MKTNNTTPQKRKSQSEMHAARGRLRGALNDSLQADADDTDSQSSNPGGIHDDLPLRGRPPKNYHQLHSPRTLRHSGGVNISPSKFHTPSKKRRREQSQLVQLQHQHLSTSTSANVQQKIQAESFVMKLFDRSLDLSKYTEQTSLYPICRAWMANQPRNPNIRSYREQRSPSPVQRKENGVELLTQLRRKELREITAMPAPSKSELPKIPDMPLEKTENRSLLKVKIDRKVSRNEALGESVLPDRGNDDDDGDQVTSANSSCAEQEKLHSREQLLAAHTRKWKQIKTKWLQHTKLYQKRYEINQLLIQELFKP